MGLFIGLGDYPLHECAWVCVNHAAHSLLGCIRVLAQMQTYPKVLLTLLRDGVTMQPRRHHQIVAIGPGPELILNKVTESSEQENHLSNLPKPACLDIVCQHPG